MSEAVIVTKEILILPYSANGFSLFGSLKLKKKKSMNVSWLTIQKVIKEI